MSGSLSGYGHGGRVIHLPPGLRWNDFQKYYRGHPNGSTADRWQEYQQCTTSPPGCAAPLPAAHLPRPPRLLSVPGLVGLWAIGLRVCVSCAVRCYAVVRCSRAVHAARAAAQKAAADALPEDGGEKRKAVWAAPRPITPTKRLVSDVADRLWERKQSGDYRQWTRPDPAAKRQRSAAQVVLER